MKHSKEKLESGKQEALNVFQISRLLDLIKAENDELKKLLESGVTTQYRKLLEGYFEWKQSQNINTESYQESYLIDEYLDSLNLNNN